ncbi:MAG: hypothetical protein EBT68_01225 [Verrucomicrobia bacterium]|nr:hypothetical protein [Verrucomicrobiota bacterium]
MNQGVILVLLLACSTFLRAETCPEACAKACGTEKSCCPVKNSVCSPTPLERGGNPGSAYSSKGGLRLR